MTTDNRTNVQIVADALRSMPDAERDDDRDPAVVVAEYAVAALEAAARAAQGAAPQAEELPETGNEMRGEAERDAAVAAIERVRAINTGNNRALYGNDFEAGMAKALWLVKAALDGAPEPEEKP